MRLPIAFRILPDGAPVPLRRLQWRKIAACLWQNREAGVLGRTILNETDIDKWHSRLSEMKRWLGFLYLTDDLPNARLGDQRKLFRHHPSVELLWEDEDEAE